MPHTTRAIAGAATPAASMSRPEHTNGTLLAISEECVGRRAVLSAAGEVDISNAAELRAAIESAGTRAFEVWLDLTALTFMDSSGLHAMSEARVRLIEANRRLTLICPEGAVLRVLAVTGCDRIFEIHPSRSAANHATLA